MWLRFRSCKKCCSVLVLDGKEWRCWQCSRYSFSTPPATDPPPEPVVAGQSGLALGKTVTEPRSRRSAGDISSVIPSTGRSELRWLYQNRDVIRYLDEGRTVKEIATLINCGQWQIRFIRWRLNDLRDCGAEMQPAG